MVDTAGTIHLTASDYHLCFTAKFFVKTKKEKLSSFFLFAFQFLVVFY